MVVVWVLDGFAGISRDVPGDHGEAHDQYRDGGEVDDIGEGADYGDHGFGYWFSVGGGRQANGAVVHHPHIPLRGLNGDLRTAAALGLSFDLRAPCPVLDAADGQAGGQAELQERGGEAELVGQWFRGHGDEWFLGEVGLNALSALST